MEIALSVGLIGLGIFIAVFSIVAVSSAKVFNKSNSMIEKSVVVFAILGVVAIIVPNLFNAGLFLGFVWLFFWDACNFKECVVFFTINKKVV